MSDDLAHRALRIAFAAGANNPSHIIDALEAAGLGIFAISAKKSAFEIGKTPTDDPRAYVRDVMVRHDIGSTNLARAVGLAASTLNRFLCDESSAALLSVRTLQKIKEWDQAQ